jgi:serine protease AprX
MKEFCQAIISPAARVVFLIIAFQTAYAHGGNTDSGLYWIFFRDKASAEPVNISDKACIRRSARAATSGFSWLDTPVSREYVEDIVARNIDIRNTSRWLNAVSAFMDREEILEVRGLPYVAGIKRVSSYVRPRAFPEPARPPQLSKIAAFDYGFSYAQISQINVDSLHNLGLSGSGVMIGIMDTGFDTSHTVFSLLRAGNRIVATYDFINDDSNVVDQPDVQRTHGTQVLSVLAGFEEGSLIGPAFGADIVLAKTEIVYNEIQAEEDNWIAAAEWMESLGVDIISSSVGYIDWYDTTQLDGQTAAITQAADIAASLGVIVVNSAGNEGNTSWRKVIPPADGDSVIAVGAVDSAGEIADFSSRGPTADGRIKPDFCALGISVYTAGWTGGYGFSGGTSFAAPLISGGIALLLEGHPEWTYGDILGALRTSASRSVLPPNNTYGWGIPDFGAAFYGHSGMVTGNGISILIAPHPAVDSTVFYLTLVGTGEGELTIHDVSGALVRRFSFEAAEPGVARVTWYGRNEHNHKAASGIYICKVESGNQTATDKFFFISSR